MADATKHLPINGSTLISDLKRLLSLRTKRTRTFAYGFIFAFILFTIFLAFNPSPNPSSPWFSNIFTSSSVTSTIGSANSTSVSPDGSLRSQFNSIYSYFFQTNSSSPSQSQSLITQNSTFVSSPLVSNSTYRSQNATNLQPKVENKQPIVKNQTQTEDLHDKVGVLNLNQTSINPNHSTIGSAKSPAVANQTANSARKSSPSVKNDSEDAKKAANQTANSAPKSSPSVKNDTEIAEKAANSAPKSSPSVKNDTGIAEKGILVKNLSSSFVKKEKQSNGTDTGVLEKQGSQDLVKGLLNCDLFDGEWVKDESYPLYKPGSCSLIDEQFGCLENGRPDKGFQHMKWKPYGCTLPRLDGSNMLQLLKGKRLVFVGDSLNRNMWESLICILRNSVKDQSKVYEASGRHHFRSEASYSFVFKDYSFTVEFFVSPFLVRESETKDRNGTKKETLRLDLLGTSADQYKNADIVIFNTGHWWTHDKTAKGKDYYQEGSHVYSELNVLEAFRKAITTWGRWIDANINPMKTTVFFRGYSASHFSGGQWNSGGQCDNEVEPIKNKTYLKPYPPKMMVLEKVIKNMKTPVSYLNITSLTDYRKDGHPSIYRKRHSNEEEKIPQLQFQDCSHWCLPGVPDAWNELLYGELLIKQYQKQQQQQKGR